jgi:hypothetical protein
MQLEAACSKVPNALRSLEMVEDYFRNGICLQSEYQLTYRLV